MSAERHDVALDDGRVLEVWATPATTSAALLMILGTPSSGIPSEEEAAAAARAGVRYVTFSRAGYGDSTRRPGRTVSDVAADTRSVASALGLERLHVVGHSGGGPHALACGALLPGLVTSVATIAGVAPWGAEGLNWLDGMATENHEEFHAALAGEDAVTAYLEPWRHALAGITVDALAESFGGLVSEVDRAALTGAYAETMAARTRNAVTAGTGGWVDDDLAFTRAWGFSLEAIACPVSIWQGGEDRMVPFAHGEWLAARIPGAVAHLLPDEGHLSLASARFDDIVADVVARGA